MLSRQINLQSMDLQNSLAKVTYDVILNGYLKSYICRVSLKNLNAYFKRDVAKLYSLFSYAIFGSYFRISGFYIFSMFLFCTICRFWLDVFVMCSCIFNVSLLKKLFLSTNT